MKRSVEKISESMRGTYTHGGVVWHLFLSPRSKCTSPAETGYDSPRSSVVDACHSFLAGRYVICVARLARYEMCQGSAKRRGANYFETGGSYFGLRYDI